MDNRGDELREQRYALLTRLFGVPGQTARGLGATSAQADAAEVEGRYERAADDGLQVQPLGDGLGVTDADRCVPLDQDHPGLWVSRNRLGPGEAPWGPHAWQPADLPEPHEICGRRSQLRAPQRAALPACDRRIALSRNWKETS